MQVCNAYLNLMYILTLLLFIFFLPLGGYTKRFPVNNQAEGPAILTEMGMVYFFKKKIMCM